MAYHLLRSSYVRVAEVSSPCSGEQEDAHQRLIGTQRHRSVHCRRAPRGSQVFRSGDPQSDARVSLTEYYIYKDMYVYIYTCVCISK